MKFSVAGHNVEYIIDTKNDPESMKTLIGE